MISLYISSRELVVKAFAGNNMAQQNYILYIYILHPLIPKTKTNKICAVWRHRRCVSSSCNFNFLSSIAFIYIYIYLPARLWYVYIYIYAALMLAPVKYIDFEKDENSPLLRLRRRISSQCVYIYTFTIYDSSLTFLRFSWNTICILRRAPEQTISKRERGKYI